MSDSIEIEGQAFVSAKRAAKDTGYSRDYVGQLARSGHIAARRVEGLWYVSLDSLNAYRTKAEEYKSEPPVPTPPIDADAGVVFNGKEFVSASRAAKLSGYHQDYVSQLARTGKIASRQMGNRWFIDCDALLAHKKEKDALLAAVQSESVGLSNSPVSSISHAVRNDSSLSPRIPAHEDAKEVHTEPYFTYAAEQADLTPQPSLGGSQPTRYHIRTLSAEQPVVRSVQSKPVSPAHYVHQRKAPAIIRSNTAAIPAQHTSSLKRRLLAPVALTVVVIFTFGFTSLREKALFAISTLHGNPQGQQQASAVQASSFIQSAAEFVETHLANELNYQSTR